MVFYSFNIVLTFQFGLQVRFVKADNFKDHCGKQEKMDIFSVHVIRLV